MLTGSGSSSLSGSTKAEKKESHMVILAGAPGKILNGIEDWLLEMVKRRVVPPNKGFAQARDAEQLLIGVRSFGDSITKKDKCVANFEFHTCGFVLGARD